jgi:hypothetical protein
MIRVFLLHYFRVRDEGLAPQFAFEEQRALFMFRSKRGLDDGFCADPSLQKRQRLPQGSGLALHPYNENSTHFGNELLGDGNRRKRSRGFGEDCGAGLAEQRMLHMQQQVQQRDDEIAKLRQMLAQRDAQLADKRRLLDAAVAHCSELNTAKESVVRAAQDALGQNKILKRGVAIQVRLLAARFARSSPAPSTGLRVCAFACAAKLPGSSPSDPLPATCLPHSKRSWRKATRKSRRWSTEILRLLCTCSLRLAEQVSHHLGWGSDSDDTQTF